METQKPLFKDEDGEEVDVHMYRSMIGSLMYLASLRPDIMFAACACARYQVNLKVAHLYAVKRIFSDYAGASLDKKSTIGGSTIPTYPHHTPIFIQPSTQPQKTQQPRKPKRMDTQVPQSSDPIKNVADKDVHLVRAATTTSSLEA
ncbi:hypothetical protein Tco_0890746 [Tanacetum coccineum]|uniref:Reverse transcriptase Ty1/copia-type domain-containing protein n=1 Tax=Tanacetum coccineum TaxID=301880 RepID=A0ABQ5C2V5_9ASTR